MKSRVKENLDRLDHDAGSWWQGLAVGEYGENDDVPPRPEEELDQYAGDEDDYE